MEKLERLALETMGEGQIGKAFEIELKKVVEDIRNTSTVALAVRKIIIEIALVPTEDRDAALIAVTTKTKLAPQILERLICKIHKKGEKYVAMERIGAKQQTLEMVAKENG